MKNKLILFSLACVTMLGANTIKSIDYKNLNKISPKIVNETLSIKTGDEINYYKINQALKKFYRFGYFDDILVDEKDGKLTFIFKEKPSIAKIDIKGFKSRSEDIESIKSFIKIKKGSMYTEQKVKEAKKILLDMLENEGYINSVVETEIENLNENSIALTFNVNKGDEIIIRKANYYGAKDLKQDDFDTVTANKEIEFAPWWFGQNDGEVKIDQLQFDARRINELYYEKGFLDASVKEPFLDIDFASNNAKIDFFIKEGKKYITNDIKIFVDESIVKASDIYPELDLIKGNTFNIKKLRRDKDLIRKKVANKGYAFAEVKFDVKKDIKNHKVDVVFSVIPKQKVYINDVIISGNTKTLDRVIRRNIFLAPKDLFNLSDYEYSKKRLKRSRNFEKVTFEEKRISEDKIDILVKVVEAPTGSLMLGGGYGSYDKLMINGSISDSNIFGSGIGTSLNLDLSKRRTRFGLNIKNPAIFDSEYNGEIDIHNSKSEMNRRTYDLKKKSKGAYISVGKEFFRDFYAGLTYRIDFIKEDYSYDEPYIDENGLEVKRKNNPNYYQDIKYVTSSLTPYIRFDNTDNYYVPREGFRIGTSLEYAGVGGDSKYLQSNSYFKYFYSLEDSLELDWIIRLKTQAKILVDKGQINPGDSLYLGGPRSLRGFEPYAFGPNDIDGRKETPYKKLWANSLELSFPLIPSAKMRWALFYDYGMIGKNDFDEIKRSSTGALIEWISPVGPLQLIFSRPLDDEKGDETSSFEFSIGASF